MKSLLLRIYNYPKLSNEKTNYHQKTARDTEWSEVKKYIKKGMFLDVGCGAGYSMYKAQQELNCEVFGIDPDPLGHGVGRRESNFNIDIKNIKTAFSENIPFADNTFDTVFSSHVLEHVVDVTQTLQEIKRVMKNDGTLVIGMPTATMALINWITQFIFTTHTKLVNVLFSKIINTGKTKWWEIIVPVSHTDPNIPIFYDLKHYKVSNWKKLIEAEFEIEKIVLPCLYPYPEYRQLFKLRKLSNFSSSVFFICKQK